MKKAIDEGYPIGPRIYASGAAIGMTSGHGDYRWLNELPRQLGGPAETPLERLGMTVFADGVPEVLTASRDQMRRGAHFLKIFVGGAVSGLRDPFDIMEYSFEEIKAAADWQAVAISSFSIPVPHSPNSNRQTRATVG